MTMSNTKKAQIGKSKATWMPKMYDWGLYFWRLPDGHLFKDQEGNLLNIPSMRGDLSKIAELRKAAAYYGQPEGEAWFYAGIKRATDEQYEEQKQRLKEGLIPNLDDLGAVHAAQQGIKRHGNQE
jgi:hypothetical protein